MRRSSEFGDRSVETSVAADDLPVYPHDLRESTWSTASRQPQDCARRRRRRVARSLGRRVLPRRRARRCWSRREVSADQVARDRQPRPDAPTPARRRTVHAADRRPEPHCEGHRYDDCVADFRRADMALGGPGRPARAAVSRLAVSEPASDRCVVLNIGGIANVTVLPATEPISGFDTGPGNTLLDAWVRRASATPPLTPAANGPRAATSDAALLSSGCCDDPYFAQGRRRKAPGFEYFNLETGSRTAGQRLSPSTCRHALRPDRILSIADAIEASCAASTRTDVLVCGGGVHTTRRSCRDRRSWRLPERRWRRLPRLRSRPGLGRGLCIRLARQCGRWPGGPATLPVRHGRQQAAVLGRYLCRPA